MKLSKRLRKWKGNLTTQTPAEYVLTLRADVNGFADEVKALEAENASLRALLSEMLGSCCKYHSCDWECKHSYRSRKERCRLRDSASELGIEVDES